MIKRLIFLNKHRCYLAGGTSLALQIGHRPSLGFDFYTHEHSEEDLKRGRMIFDKDFSWKRVKAEILTEVRKYQLDLLK